MDHSLTPALFVSHGSPMWALEPGESGPALTAWAQRHTQAPESPPAGPAWRAVVVMSPHWMAPQAAVMAHPQPHTWHDFGGFPPALYALQYPAPGEPDLAQRVWQCLQRAGIASVLDTERPRDHGAWVPLMHLLPQAPVPVIQVALPTQAGPRDVYAIGQALAGLREEGVLLIGSGSMTHNLREFFTGMPAQDDPPEPYASAFSRWVEDTLRHGDHEALFDYRQRAPHAVRAHPTEEHFLPLFFTLGAAGWGGAPAKPDYVTREIMHRYLAMDAFALA